MELFDDNSNDEFPNEEWILRRVDENGKSRRLYANVLVRDQGLYNWRRLEIVSYCERTDKFNVICNLTSY